MEKSDLESKEREILNKIFIREEDTLRDLDFIVEKSLKYFKINFSGDKNIIFEKHVVKVLDKMRLFFIALYLLNKQDKSSSVSVNIAKLSNALSIKKTSLSKPLKTLVNEGYLKKDESGNYSIEYYKIKEALINLENE